MVWDGQLEHNYRHELRKSWRLGETRLGPRTPQLRRLKNLPQDVRARLFTQCKLLLIYTLLVLGVVWEQQRARNTGTWSVSSGTLAHDGVTCRFRVLYHRLFFSCQIMLFVLGGGGQTSQIPADTAVATHHITPSSATCGALRKNFAGGEAI